MNKRERQALRGLPHLPILIYHQSLKPRMDFATGYIGMKKGCAISWQAISEDLEIEGAPGIKRERPKRGKLRRAVEQLQSRGLIQQCTVKQTKKLFFRCLLATVDQSVQNKVSHKCADIPDHNHPITTPEIASDNVNTKPQSATVLPPESAPTSYSIDNTVCVCVAPGEKKLTDFFGFYVEQNRLNRNELLHNIRDYLDFCKNHNRNPTVHGCGLLLKSRISYQAINAAKQQKLRAIAIREETTADEIHSGNIAKRSLAR